MTNQTFFIIALVISFTGMVFEIKNGFIPDSLSLPSILLMLIARGIWKEHLYFYYFCGFLMPLGIALLQIKVLPGQEWIGMGLLKVIAACGIAIGWRYCGISILLSSCVFFGFFVVRLFFDQFERIPGTPIYFLCLLAALKLFKL